MSYQGLTHHIFHNSKESNFVVCKLLFMFFLIILLGKSMRLYLKHQFNFVVFIILLYMYHRTRTLIKFTLVGYGNHVTFMSWLKSYSFVRFVCGFCHFGTCHIGHSIKAASNGAYSLMLLLEQKKTFFFNWIHKIIAVVCNHPIS